MTNADRLGNVQEYEPGEIGVNFQLDLDLAILDPDSPHSVATLFCSTLDLIMRMALLSC